jgi:DnaA regulatory inactivator Hda
MTALAEQIPLDLIHRPAQGREDFLVAPSNQEAVSWVDQWPNWPAPALILYGPASSGKTHLAAVWKNKCNAKFLNSESLDKMEADEISNLAEHIVIDHVDPWFGDKKAETTLFHLYNIMKEEDRSLLITSRVAPSHVSFLIPDLASRLRAAPLATIHSPDDTLLCALLVKLYADRQIKINQDILNYVLPRMERSFYAAKNLVEKSDKLALSEKRPISIPLMRKVFLMDDQQA